MKSEALRNIRTMRQVKASLDVVRGQKPRTTNCLSKTGKEIEYLESLTDRCLEQTLEKERRRFVAQETGINKSRQRLLMSREKLAMTLNRNRALTELRHQLQQSRWEDNDPVDLKTGTSGRESTHQIELRY